MLYFNGKKYTSYLNGVKQSFLFNGVTYAKEVQTVPEDVITYSEITASLSLSSTTNIAAAGGTVTVKPTYSQIKYVNGVENSTITTDAKVTFAIDSDYVSVGATVNQSGVVTFPSNQTTAIKTTKVNVTISLNGKTKNLSIEVKQSGAVETFQYSTPVVTVSMANADSIDNTAGSYQLNISYSQNVTSNLTGLSTSITSITSVGAVKCVSNATSIASVTDAGLVTFTANPNYSTRQVTITVTVTMNGKSGNETITLTQNAKDEITVEYSDITITPKSVSNVAATGGTVTLEISYSQSYLSSTNESGTISTGGNVSWEKVSGGTANYTVTPSDVNNTTVVFAENETTSSKTAKVKVTVSSHGKVNSYIFTVTQNAGTNSHTYSNISLLSYTFTDTAPASGGTIRPEYSYKQYDYYYVNGVKKSETILTSGATVTFSKSSTQPSNVANFSVISAGTSAGLVTVSSNGGSNALNGNVDIKIEMNNKTTTGRTSFTQTASSIVYGTPVVTMTATPSAMTAFSGSSSVKCTYSQSQTINGKASTPITSGGAIRYEFKGGSQPSYVNLSQNGSAATVTFSENTTTSDRSATLLCYVGLNGVTGYTETTIKQTKATVVDKYSAITVNATFTDSAPATGGTLTPEITYSQVRSRTINGKATVTTFTSGGTVTVKKSSSQPNDVADFSITNDNKVSVSFNNATSARHGSIDVIVGLNGYTGTTTTQFTQVASTATFGEPVVTSISSNPSTITAKSGSTTLSVTYWQPVYVGNTSESATTGAAIAYTIVSGGSFAIISGNKLTYTQNTNSGSTRVIKVKATVGMNGYSGYSQVLTLTQPKATASVVYTGLTAGVDAIDIVPADGGYFTPEIVYNQKKNTIVNGNIVSSTTITTGATITLSASTTQPSTPAEFRISGNSIYVLPSDATTSRQGNFDVKVQLNGETKIITGNTFTQEAYTAPVYGNIILTTSFKDNSSTGLTVPFSTSSISLNIAYRQTKTYNGVDSTITSGGTVKVTMTENKLYSSNDSFITDLTFSPNVLFDETTKSIIVNPNYYIKSNIIQKYAVTVTLNDKSATKYLTLKQNYDSGVTVTCKNSPIEVYLDDVSLDEGETISSYVNTLDVKVITATTPTFKVRYSNNITKEYEQQNISPILSVGSACTGYVLFNSSKTQLTVSDNEMENTRNVVIDCLFTGVTCGGYAFVNDNITATYHFELEQDGCPVEEYRDAVVMYASAPTSVNSNGYSYSNNTNMASSSRTFKPTTDVTQTIHMSDGSLEVCHATGMTVSNKFSKIGTGNMDFAITSAGTISVGPNSDPFDKYGIYKVVTNVNGQTGVTYNLITQEANYSDLYEYEFIGIISDISSKKYSKDAHYEEFDFSVLFSRTDKITGEKIYYATNRTWLINNYSYYTSANTQQAYCNITQNSYNSDTPDNIKMSSDKTKFILDIPENDKTYVMLYINHYSIEGYGINIERCMIAVSQATSPENYTYRFANYTSNIEEINNTYGDLILKSLIDVRASTITSDGPVGFIDYNGNFIYASDDSTLTVADSGNTDSYNGIFSKSITDMEYYDPFTQYGNYHNCLKLWNYNLFDEVKQDSVKNYFIFNNLFTSITVNFDVQPVTGITNWSIINGYNYNSIYLNSKSSIFDCINSQKTENGGDIIRQKLVLYSAPSEGDYYRIKLHDGRLIGFTNTNGDIFCNSVEWLDKHMFIGLEGTERDSSVERIVDDDNLITFKFKKAYNNSDTVKSYKECIRFNFEVVDTYNRFPTTDNSFSVVYDIDVIPLSESLYVSAIELSGFTANAKFENDNVPYYGGKCKLEPILNVTYKYKNNSTTVNKVLKYSDISDSPIVVAKLDNIAAINAAIYEVDTETGYIEVEQNPFNTSRTGRANISVTYEGLSANSTYTFIQDANPYVNIISPSSGITGGKNSGITLN